MSPQNHRWQSDIESSSASDIDAAAPAAAASAAAQGQAPSSSSSAAADPTQRAQEIIDRAARVLEAAREALGRDDAAGAATAAVSAAAAGGGGAGGSSVVGRVGTLPQQPPEAAQPRWGPMGDDGDLTRHVLQGALDDMARTGAGGGGGASAAAPSAGSGAGSWRDSNSSGGGGGGSSSSAAPSDGGGAAPPLWAASFLSSDSPAASGDGPGLQLQAAPRAPVLAFAEPEPPAPTAALLLASQEAQDRERARGAVLPPLQSVVELTTAFRPPERGAPAPAADAVGAATAAPSLAGRALADGSGALPDGSTWEKKSGVEYGEVRARVCGGGEGEAFWGAV